MNRVLNPVLGDCDQRNSPCLFVDVSLLHVVHFAKRILTRQPQTSLKILGKTQNMYKKILGLAPTH